ncbi:unnamed protein product [Dibothriocephalus latus]|uniref:Uncharacterized protein n=1 Tax=Dibothriocephalus latus TaxID=60516 RepID=A0A3P7R7V7_DIBLA|nr:unnamed protein product [Dibothriocephalus latus]
MAFVETNPEKLRELTEEAKSKENKDLGFYPSAVDAADNWIAKFFSPKDPFHSGDHRKRILYMEKVRKQKNFPPMDPPPYSSLDAVANYTIMHEHLRLWVHRSRSILQRRRANTEGP